MLQVAVVPLTGALMDWESDGERGSSLSNDRPHVTLDPAGGATVKVILNVAATDPETKIGGGSWARAGSVIMAQAATLATTALRICPRGNGRGAPRWSAGRNS